MELLEQKKFERNETPLSEVYHALHIIFCEADIGSTDCTVFLQLVAQLAEFACTVVHKVAYFLDPHFNEESDIQECV